MAINSLGPLEADIMQVIWTQDKVSVQDVHSELNKNRQIAYNTVMTVMTRLAKKEVLGRRKLGRLYLYHPLVTRAEIGKQMLQYLLDKVYAGNHQPLMDELDSMLTETKEA